MMKLNKGVINLENSSVLSQTNEAINMRKLRKFRSDNHLCTRCGNKLPDDYCKKLCKDCKTYISDYRLPNPITNEELAFLQFRKRGTPPVGEFGRRLKTLMLINIESPKTLSVALGVTSRTIERWLYGGAIPLKHRWQEIADYFSCDINDLGL